MVPELLAAAVIIDSDKGDEDQLLKTVFDEKFRLLDESPLRNLATEVVVRACNSQNRDGPLWQLPWTLVGLSDAQLDQARALFEAENSIQYIADEIGCADLGTDELITSLAEQGTMAGLASAPLKAPTWLGLSEEKAALFEKVRYGLAPTASELRQEFRRVYDKADELVDAGRFSDALDRLYKCHHMAISLGLAQLQVAIACDKAQIILRSASDDRFDYAEVVDLLRDAWRVARPFAALGIRPLTMLGKFLKDWNLENRREALKEAQAALRTALELARVSAPDLIASTTIDFANALMESQTPDDLDEAGRLLLAAIHHGNDDRDLFGTIYNSLGNLECRRHEMNDSVEHLENAAEYFRFAVKVRKKLPDREKYLRSLSNLIGVYRRQRDSPPNEIRVVAADLLAICDSAGPEELSRDAMSSALNNAASALAKIGDGSATLVARRAVEVAPEGRLLAAAATTAAHVFLEAGDALQAKEMAEKGIEAFRRLRERTHDTISRAQQAHEVAVISSHLAEALARLGRSDQQFWWAIEGRFGTTLEENRQRLFGLAAPSRKVVLATLAKHLPCDALILQLYMNQKNEINAIAIRQTASRIEIIRGLPSITLRHFAKAADGGIVGRDLYFTAIGPEVAPEWDRRFLAWLGEQFIGPVLEKLDLKQPKTLYLVLPDFLSHIPWHAIPISPNGPMLASEIDVIEVPSTVLITDLLEAPQTKRRRALVACDSSRRLVKHYEELRSAIAEINIEDLVFLSDKSRPVLRAQVAEHLQSTDLFHFAGHGHYDPQDPSRTGLQLSDGLLSMVDLENSLSRHAPDVVILSACNSGLTATTDIDGVNLLTAFSQFGTRAAIGSLWAIPDAFAAENSRLMYSKLDELGAPRALNYARRVLSNHTNRTFRQHAAAFKVVGVANSGG